MTPRFTNHLLIIVCVFYSFLCYAHDVNKAYFKIQSQENNTIVFAELPWSIRKVIDNIPSNKDVTIQDKMLSYLKNNLILENQDGKILSFEKAEFIKDKKEEGHHSMVNYKIYFEGVDLYKVTNTIMCDYYKNQLNYHLLFDLPDSKITSAIDSSFVLQESSFKLELIYYVVGIFLLLIFVYVIYKIT